MALDAVIQRRIAGRPHAEQVSLDNERAEGLYRVGTASSLCSRHGRTSIGLAPVACDSASGSVQEVRWCLCTATNIFSELQRALFDVDMVCGRPHKGEEKS